MPGPGLAWQRLGCYLASCSWPQAPHARIGTLGLRRLCVRSGRGSQGRGLGAGLGIGLPCRGFYWWPQLDNNRGLRG